MGDDQRKPGSDLFIVDNSDADWKVRNYLTEWCGLAKTIDIAAGYFEIGALLALRDAWQAVDHLRILMGDEVSRRTQQAFRKPAVRAAQAVLQRAKDEIDAQRDELIRRIERPLRPWYDVRNVFAPRWVQRA